MALHARSSDVLRSRDQVLSRLDYELGGGNHRRLESGRRLASNTIPNAVTLAPAMTIGQGFTTTQTARTSSTSIRSTRSRSPLSTARRNHRRSRALGSTPEEIGPAMMIRTPATMRSQAKGLMTEPSDGHSANLRSSMARAP